MENRTAIVIVTYNPDISNLQHVLNELRNYYIIVSDNASKNSNDIKKVTNISENIQIISSKSNEGIGTAQNLAINKIKEETDKDYIFFLDQDSFISAQNLFKLEKDLDELEKLHKRIGILAAISSSELTSESKFENANEVISSGMLIPIKVLNKLGTMKEDFFIDMIDYEWCWRAGNAGYSIVRDNHVQFIHQIGTKDRILGKIPVAPFRLYYVYRNTIYMLKSSYLPKGYNLKLRYGLFKQLIFNALFCPDRIKRIKYILKGIKDGENRKLGQLNE